MNGLRIQVEFNGRFTAADGRRYLEARQGADKIWSTGRDYKEGLLKLLKELLCEVDWREALARACAELLDGRWARRYTIRDDLFTGASAWPAQQQGLAQAMYIIENVGSVLIADAAGSGKTYLGAHVLRAVVNRVWGSGLMRNPSPVVIAPPKTLTKWREDTRAAEIVAELLSFGQLRETKDDSGINAIQRAQVVAIDEAHNFLNLHSQRTKLVLRNVADHVVLLTATPINREAGDLLKLINLLGPDNFDDSVLQLLEDLLHSRRGRGRKDTKGRARSHNLTQDEVMYLQTQIDKFTLRRTRAQFNAMITADPDRYLNKFGRRCRYPEQRTEVYDTGETNEDNSNADHIRMALLNLKGILNIGARLEVPDTRWWRQQPQPDSTFLELVLRGAKSLAVHNVLASLRSSRAALLEHLQGTAEAWRRLDMPGAPYKSQRLGVLHQLTVKADTIPTNRLAIDLPDWLADSEAHRRACEEEANTYRLIATFAERISAARENRKAGLLAELLHTHALVVAFDRRLITLVYLDQLLQERHGRTIMATSQNARAVADTLRLFALGSDARGYIALCSDAMAEGVNMQAATAMVHLDMPTVIRLLEQRDGRISRMDSDNPVIWTYLPKDGPSFVTRADELLHARSLLVRDLIGANVELPEELTQEFADDADAQVLPEEGIVTPEVILDSWQRMRRQIDSLPDAFSPIRALVSGPDALVPPDIYQHYRTATGRVISSISIVQAVRPWAFFAIAGSELGAPRFIYLDDQQELPTIDLLSVCQALRTQLRPDTPRRAFDADAAAQLNHFLDKVVAREELLLPLKKRRALEQMRTVLKHYLRQLGPKKPSRPSTDSPLSDQDDRRQVIESILDLVENPGPRFNSDGTAKVAVDVGMVAERWLHAVRPVWYRVLQDRPSLKLLLLKHLRAPLLEQPLATDELRTILVNDALWIRPLDERVVATIIGVPEPSLVGSQGA